MAAMVTAPGTAAALTGFADNAPLQVGPRPLEAAPLRPRPTSDPVTVSGELSGGVVRTRIRYLVRPRKLRGHPRVPFRVRVGTLNDIDRARKDPHNLWAEPAYRTAAVVVPDDPLYPSQSQDFTRAGDDGFRAAWEVTTGRPPLGGTPPIIAIVDSGIELAHPDLAPNLWTNPGEIPGNGIDDDRNGYVDDVHGADIVSPGTPPDDEYFHGTAVAGIAGARGDDGLGVAGVAWIARLMAVRVLDAQGAGDTSQLAEGIRYAADNGAQVINVSMTTDARTRAVDDAITEAQSAGALVVASAGNDFRDLALTPAYPASSTNPAVISVAATASRGVLASFSNFGRTGVDIGAPGVDLLTTQPGDSYASFTGTSAAAPVVAGTVALMRAAQPQASAEQIRATLLATSQRSAVPVRAGELRAGAALAAVAPTDIGTTLQKALGVPYVTVKTTVTQRPGPIEALSVRWTVRKSAKHARRATMTIHRGKWTGPLLWRHATRVSGTTGRLAATARTRRGKKDDLVVKVRVTSADGTVLGTGRQVLALH